MDWLFSKSLPTLKFCDSSISLYFSRNPGRQSCLEYLNRFPGPRASSWVWPTESKHTQELRGNKRAETGIYSPCFLPVGALWVGCTTCPKVTASRKCPSPHVSIHTAPPPDSGNCSHCPPLLLQMVVTPPSCFQLQDTVYYLWFLCTAQTLVNSPFSKLSLN